jgi:hypothetical protein
MIPAPFEEVWRRVARWDARPTVRIPIAAPGAVETVSRSLTSFADGGDVLVDSPRMSPRPSRFKARELAAVVGIHRGALEFVVARAERPGSFWAVIEAEYENLIFEDA